MLSRLCSFLVLCLLSLSAQAFGNEDVIKLLAAGMDEKIVADAISNASPATFDTSANGLIALKNAGASPMIIQKVIMRQGAASAPARMARSGDDACQLESVDMAFKVPIRVEGKILGLEPSKYELDNNINLGMGLLTALTGGIVSTTGSQSAVLPGNRASTRISEKTPEFIDVLVMPDRPPEDQFFLVHLTVRDTSRTVQLGTASVGIVGGKQKRDFGENVQVAVSLEKVEDLCTWRTMRLMHYRMKPKEPLTSGEYGYILGKQIYDFGVD